MNHIDWAGLAAFVTSLTGLVYILRIHGQVKTQNGSTLAQTVQQIQDQTPQAPVSPPKSPPVPGTDPAPDLP